jgi:hypothetical protein
MKFALPDHAVPLFRAAKLFYVWGGEIVIVVD